MKIFRATPNLNNVLDGCKFKMIRQPQQFEDKLSENRLEKFKIEAPSRGGSLFNRLERSQSLSVKQSQSQHGQQTKTGGRPLYEQTYYISNVRENYLTLVSDNMEILQLPLGLIKEQIKIGLPIKLKLEYDSKRQQADQLRFKTIQKDLYKEFYQKQSADN